MPPRICIGCHSLHSERGQRCATCQAEADAKHAQQRAAAASKRPGTAARGYGNAYRRNRDRVVAAAIRAARAGRPQPCHICGLPCLASQPLTAEHKRPIRDGGGAELANLAPAHSDCNTGWNRRHAP